MAVEIVPIQVSKVEAALEKLVAPDAAEWGSATEVVVPIDPTSLERLPSAYVQVSWRNRPRGAIGEVRVRAAAGTGGGCGGGGAAAVPALVLVELERYGPGAGVGARRGER